MTYFDSISDKFDFGKFKGSSLAEVLRWNPDYVNWVIQNVSGTRCVITDKAVEEMKFMFPNIILTSDFEECRNKLMAEYELSLVCADDEEDESDYDDWGEMPTYNRYNGTYAQDEMGYSDDDIDTIFDGDPSAYWNID